MLDPSNNNYMNDNKFVLNNIAWLNGYNAFQTYYIPSTYTDVYVVTQTQIAYKTVTKSCYLQTTGLNSNSATTICTQTLSKSVFSDFAPFFLILVIIPLGYIEFRRRKILNK